MTSVVSQIKSGIHMGIVTSKPDRSDLREIYFPAHERGMAHDPFFLRTKVGLVVEMVDVFRRLPGGAFFRRFAGNAGGARRRCTSASWSPDGK